MSTGNTQYSLVKDSDPRIYEGIDCSKINGFIDCFHMNQKEYDSNGAVIQSTNYELTSISGVWDGTSATMTVTGTWCHVTQSLSITANGYKISDALSGDVHFGQAATYKKLEIGSSYSDSTDTVLETEDGMTLNFITYRTPAVTFQFVDYNESYIGITYSNHDKLVYGSSCVETITAYYKDASGNSRVIASVSYSTITDNNVASLSFTNAKSVYECNEELAWNAGDSLSCLDSSGNVIQTWTGSDIANAVSQTNGSLSHTTDGKQTITYIFSYKQTLTFAKYLYANFSLTALSNPVYSSVKTEYIWSRLVTGFDFSNLTLTETRHENDSNGTVTSEIIHTFGTGTYPLSVVQDDNVSIDYASERYYSPSFTCSNAYGQTLSYTFSSSSHIFHGVPLAITSVTLNVSSDPIQYWDNLVDTFHYPTTDGTTKGTLSIVYNDTQFNQSVSADNANVSYYSDSALSNALTTSIALPTIYKIYCKFIDSSNVYSGNAAICGSTYYGISFTHDYIESVTVVSAPTIVKGNYLSKYKSSFSLTANYKSGEVTKTSWGDWSFGFSSILVPTTNSDLINYASGTITIYDGDTDNTAHSSGFVLSGIIFSNPSLESITLSSFVTNYNNKSDKVNLSNVTATKKYADAVYTSATTSTSFSDTISVDKAILTINTSDSAVVPNSQLNGTDKLAVTMGTNTEIVVPVSFSVSNDFDTTLNKTTSVSITIIEITEIQGISFANTPYTNYHVGDTFLNDTDDTEIIVYYLDTNSTRRSYTTLLRDGLSSLNVYPLKGTKFVNAVASKTIKITSAYDANVCLTYDITVSNNVTYDYETKTMSLGVIKLLSDATYVAKTKDGEKSITLKAGTYAFVDSSYITSGTVSLKPGYSLATRYDDTVSVLIKGYLDLSGSDNNNVVLLTDYVPPVDGESNITLLYPHYDSDGLAFIDGMTFGCQFGHNNAMNRLWLSGNASHKNFDIHSCEPNESNYDGAEEVSSTTGDFSYFAYRDQAKYGETDNAIVGFDVVSDSKLLVIKDHSDKEPSLYFRVPQLVQWYDWTGVAKNDISGNALYEEQYTKAVSNSPVSGISPLTVANFNGDTLFVDNDNEIAGLDLEGIVGDSQRQANTRSYYIDKQLKEADLTDSLLWTKGRSLFLSVPNVGMFVSDRDSKSNSQYEWWKLDTVNPTCLFEIAGKTYMGDKNGYLYSFDSGSYKDTIRVFANEGEVLEVNAYSSGDKDNAVIIASSDVMSQIDDDKYDYTFTPIYPSSDLLSKLFRRMGSISTTLNAGEIYCDTSNNVLAVTDKSVANLLRISSTYYLNNASDKTYVSTKGDTVLNWLIKYRLVLVDDVPDYGYSYYDLFKLQGYLNGAWTDISLSAHPIAKADLCETLEGEYKIVGIDLANSLFRLADDNSNIIDITKYSSQPINLSLEGEVTRYESVCSRFVTAPLFNETMNLFKTIWKIDVSNGSEIPSDLSIAYVSNKIPSAYSKKIADVSKAALGLDLNDFDFSKTDFDKKSVPRYYTIRKTMARLKSICFAFESNSPSNSVLPGLELTYTIPMPSKGSD